MHRMGEWTPGGKECYNIDKSENSETIEMSKVSRDLLANILVLTYNLPYNDHLLMYF